MSMPQSKTSDSGTQHSKNNKPNAIIDLTEADEIPKPFQSNPTKHDSSYSSSFDQKSKDKYKNMFNKFSSPMIPPSKPAGKQNWSWDDVDGSTQSEEMVLSGGKAQIPSPGKGDTFNGYVSIFGPRKPLVSGQSAATTQVGRRSSKSDEAAFPFTELPEGIRASTFYPTNIPFHLKILQRKVVMRTG